MQKTQFVKVSWIDSMTISGAHTSDEIAVAAANYDDLRQVSIGELIHSSKTHICLASMRSVDGNIGLAVKIPRFAITKIERLKVAGKLKATGKGAK